MKLEIKPRLPVHSLYALGMLLFGIVACAVVWYIHHYVYYYISTVSQYAMQLLGTNSSESDLTVTLFDNIDVYILVFSLIVMVVWTLRYSQKKGTTYV